MKLIISKYEKSVISDDIFRRVEKMVRKAEKVANEILKLPEDVKIVVDDDKNMIDPKIGVGGYTEGKNQIDFSVDESFKKISDDEIFATLIHELSHVKRAYGPWYGETLFDYMIFEGLALRFEEEIVGDKSYYPKFIRQQQNASGLIKKFAYMFDFDDEKYDYMDFVLGNKKLEIPENAVYIMGLKFLDDYLAKNPKVLPHALLLEKSGVFRE